MTTTNITNFRKNAFNYVEQTIKYNEPLNISTKDGDAVLLSAEDYSGLMETLYLVSVPGMREKIMDGLNHPLYGVRFHSFSSYSPGKPYA